MKYITYQLNHHVMKKISFVIIAILFSQFTLAQFQYVSPSPASKNLPVEHNIIIRPGSHLDPASVKSSLFSIQGSKSGIHTFSLVLCDDGKTINLNPKIPFAFQETVSVSIFQGLMTTEQNLIESFSFSFTTHREWTAEEQEKMRSEARLLQENEFNEGTPEDESDPREINGMFTITTNSNPTPGNIFFDCKNASGWPTSYTSISMIDNNGDSLFQRTFAGLPFDFQLGKNGYFETFQADIFKFLVMDSNFAVIDTYTAANGYTGNPHELQMLANGFAFFTAEESQLMMVQQSDSTLVEENVIGNVIQEFDPDHNLVFEWRSLDHIGLDEAEHVNMGISPVDYAHTNSIDVDTDGNIIVSHRHLSQVNKIDVNTGDFIWRLGGVYNQFTFTNDAAGFSYQHDCRRLPNGNITLYDNGNYHIPQKSFAKEYQLDEVNLTATLVWHYSHPNVMGEVAYNFSQGSVQRLPNGNTLIGWGHRNSAPLPSITEIDSAGTIVWELQLSNNDNLLNYRVHKYEWNPCARPTFRLLNTVDITNHSASLQWTPVTNPSQQYEVQYKKHVDAVWLDVKVAAPADFLDIGSLDPNTEYDWRIQSWCDTLSGLSSHFTEVVNFTTLLSIGISEPGMNEVNLYPNPANDRIIILSAFKVSKIRVLNLLGQEVRDFLVSEETTDQPIQLPLSNLPSGNYLVEITGNETRELRKLIVE